MTRIASAALCSATLALAAGSASCGSSSSSNNDSGGAGAPDSGASGATNNGTGGVGGTGGSPGSGNNAGTAGSDSASTCSSDAWWSSGEGPSMRPGQPCLSCHTGSGAPRFSVAGTVYPTLAEPDNCKGTAAEGAVVVVVDGDDAEHRATVNAAGNFYLNGNSLPTPMAVRVEFNGDVNSMSSAPGSGDCNSCHTESGANGAPGRVHLP